MIWRPKKIISGGQTGADRGGLDAAIALGIAQGGWCPLGRKAEDGRVPNTYKLKQHPSPDYPPRTALNIHEADATLVFVRGEPGRGSALTISLARNQKKPCLVLDISEKNSTEKLRDFLTARKPKVLNVAGSRESHARGMQESVRTMLVSVLGCQDCDGRGQRMQHHGSDDNYDAADCSTCKGTGR